MQFVLFSPSLPNMSMAGEEQQAEAEGVERREREGLWVEREDLVQRRPCLALFIALIPLASLAVVSLLHYVGDPRRSSTTSLALVAVWTPILLCAAVNGRCGYGARVEERGVRRQLFLLWALHLLAIVSLTFLLPAHSTLEHLAHFRQERHNVTVGDLLLLRNDSTTGDAAGTVWTSLWQEGEDPPAVLLHKHMVTRRFKASVFWKEGSITAIAPYNVTLASHSHHHHHRRLWICNTRLTGIKTSPPTTLIHERLSDEVPLVLLSPAHDWSYHQCRVLLEESLGNNSTTASLPPIFSHRDVFNERAAAWRWLVGSAAALALCLAAMLLLIVYNLVHSQRAESLCVGYVRIAPPRTAWVRGVAGGVSMGTYSAVGTGV